MNVETIREYLVDSDWRDPKVKPMLEYLAKQAECSERDSLINRLKYHVIPRDTEMPSEAPDSFKALHCLLNFCGRISNKGSSSDAFQFVMGIPSVVNAIIKKRGPKDYVGLGDLIDGQQSFLILTDRYFPVRELRAGVVPKNPEPHIEAWLWMIENNVIWTYHGRHERFAIITIDDDQNTVLFKMMFC